jgi:hypothetical protein
MGGMPEVTAATWAAAAVKQRAAAASTGLSPSSLLGVASVDAACTSLLDAASTGTGPSSLLDTASGGVASTPLPGAAGALEVWSIFCRCLLKFILVYVYKFGSF